MAPPGTKADPRFILGVLLLCALGLAAYWPVFGCGFVWDDDHFLTRNPLIVAPGGLWRFWFTSQATDYWPVTSSELWCEWRLWGANALGYHATNLLLHLASAVLLWSAFRRLRVPGAYVAALFFTLHPINVESVAWITQRKNLLALIFLLLSVLAYFKEERPVPSARWQGFSLIAFALAMLSKGSVAMFPLALAGLIAFRRRLSAGDFLRLLPFGAVAAVLVGVNIWFQRHGTGEVIRQAGGVERLAGAGTVAWFYLAKAVLPLRLAFCYPQWRLHPETLSGWLPCAAAIALALALLAARTPSGRACRTGLAWYLIMLVPVMGLTDVYFFKYSLVADHYQQLALIGLAGLAGAGWERWRRSAGPVLPGAAAVLVCGTFGALIWRQCPDYRDRDTLFRAAIRENPGCWMAYNNLGLDQVNAGRYAEALGNCQAAVRLEPGFAEAHNNLGIAWAGLGRLPASIGEFREAIRLKPFYPEAYNNLGNAYRLAKELPEALRAYVRALQLRPTYAEGHNNLAVALMDLGRLPEAIAHLRAAVQLAPGYAAARENLDLALRKSALLDHPQP